MVFYAPISSNFLQYYWADITKKFGGIEQSRIIDLEKFGFSFWRVLVEEQGWLSVGECCLWLWFSLLSCRKGHELATILRRLQSCLPRQPICLGRISDIMFFWKLVVSAFKIFIYKVILDRILGMQNFNTIVYFHQCSQFSFPSTSLPLLLWWGEMTSSCAAENTLSCATKINPGGIWRPYRMSEIKYPTLSYMLYYLCNP